MAQKPKARSAKKKAVPKKKATDEKQFERFIETARELSVDESDESFERIARKVIRYRPPKARS